MAYLNKVLLIGLLVYALWIALYGLRRLRG